MCISMVGTGLMVLLKLGPKVILHTHLLITPRGVVWVLIGQKGPLLILDLLGRIRGTGRRMLLRVVGEGQILDLLRLIPEEEVGGLTLVTQRVLIGRHRIPCPLIVILGSQLLKGPACIVLVFLHGLCLLKSSGDDQVGPFLTLGLDRMRS